MTVRLYAVAIVLIAAALGRYTLACLVQPIRPCGRCAGTGRTRRGQGCRWCRTTGRRARWAVRGHRYIVRRRAARKGQTHV